MQPVDNFEFITLSKKDREEIVIALQNNNKLDELLRNPVFQEIKNMFERELARNNVICISEKDHDKIMTAQASIKGITNITTLINEIIEIGQQGKEKLENAEKTQKKYGRKGKNIIKK